MLLVTENEAIVTSKDSYLLGTHITLSLMINMHQMIYAPMSLDL